MADIRKIAKVSEVLNFFDLSNNRTVRQQIILDGSDYLIQVDEDSNNEANIFRRYKKGTRNGNWVVLFEKFRTILSKFDAPSMLRNVRMRCDGSGKVSSFELILVSGQIVFISGALSLRHISDKKEFQKELAKLDEFFEV